MTKICVVIAVYNGAKFIEEQLTSIARARIKNLYIVIVDDHSTDDSINLINQFSSLLDLRIFPSETTKIDPIKRIRDNFFLALSKFEADLYFFCDQDDIWAHDKIPVYREHLASSNVVYSGYELIGGVQGKVNVKNFNHYSSLNLILSNLCPGMCVAFDQKTRTYLLRNWDKLYYHDHAVFLVARKFNLTVSHIADTQFNQYRQHADNVIGYKTLSRYNKTIQNAKRLLKNLLIYLTLT